MKFNTKRNGVIMNIREDVLRKMKKADIEKKYSKRLAEPDLKRAVELGK